ncbi:hypothetical protein FQZ97_1072170 [compost metagenome]
MTSHLKAGVGIGAKRPCQTSTGQSGSADQAQNFAARRLFSAPAIWSPLAIWTPATGQHRSLAVPASATCCCRSYLFQISWPSFYRRSVLVLPLRRVAISRKPAGMPIRVSLPGLCGSWQSLPFARQTWLKLSVRQSALIFFSAFRLKSASSLPQPMYSSFSIYRTRVFAASKRSSSRC